VIEAQRASILEPYDHLHINHVSARGQCHDEAVAPHHTRCDQALV